MLSTRRDLLPPEFIAELSRLQDDAPQVAWPQVADVLRAELGAEVDDVFATFDRDLDIIIRLAARLQRSTN